MKSLFILAMVLEVLVEKIFKVAIFVQLENKNLLIMH